MCKDPGSQSFGHLKDGGRREDMTIRLVISPNWWYMAPIPSSLPGPPHISTFPRKSDIAERRAVGIPCCCITLKNLTMTLEEGLMRTCLLPAFSALLMAFKQSLRTEVLTILIDGGLG